MAANTPNQSAIGGYVIDFFRHLRNLPEHREEFQVFFTFWNRGRTETICALKELLQRLERAECFCDVGIAASSLSGASSTLSTLINFASTGALNPVGLAVSAGFHSLKSGSSAGKAMEISRARNTASDLVQGDYNETVRFVEMGLKFDGILREMQAIVRNIRQMTLTYTMEQIMAEMPTMPDEVGHNAAAPHRELALAIMDGVDALNQVDANNISAILGRYLRNNPDVVIAARAAGQAAFDLVGFTRLMNVPIMGDIGLRHLYVGGAIASMGADLYDVAQAITRLCTGGSVTQDLIKKIIKRLQEEQEFLTTVYNRLQRR